MMVDSLHAMPTVTGAGPGPKVVPGNIVQASHMDGTQSFEWSLHPPRVCTDGMLESEASWESNLVVRCGCLQH